MSARWSHPSHANRDISHHQGFPDIPNVFFCRPAQIVAPALIGYRLVKRQGNGSLLWGVVVGKN